MQHNGRDIGTFIATKEHRRFVEFADAVRKHRYIGLCYGPAGVGKTLSARRYAHWDMVEPFLDEWPREDRSDSETASVLARTRTILYTPSVSETLGDLKKSLSDYIRRAEDRINRHLNFDDELEQIHEHNSDIEMMIFDEAERLSMNAVEFIRSIFDKKSIGVMLIGMPGMEKRLSRFPQFYSRVGFAHHYRPLTGERRTDLRSDTPLALAGHQSRRRGLYRRAGGRDNRSDHRR